MGLEKKIEIIDRLINNYSERKENVKDHQDKKGYEQLISLLVNQKVRIQEFQSKID